VRFFILRAHYRSPLNYSDKHLDDAKQGLTRLYTALKNVPSGTDEKPIDRDDPYARRFEEAMDDDFNTPEAMAVLFDLATAANSGDVVAAAQLKAMGRVIGLLQRDPVAFLQGRVISATAISQAVVTSTFETEVVVAGLNMSVEALIEERTAAKKAKNFSQADRIRKELLDAGIVLEDKPGGVTEWRRA